MTATLDRRGLLLGGLTSSILGPRALAAERFDAVLAPRHRRDVPAGRRFVGLADAIAAAPRTASAPYRIWVARGDWVGQVTVDKPGVHLVGEDRTASRIGPSRNGV